MAPSWELVQWHLQFAFEYLFRLFISSEINTDEGTIHCQRWQESLSSSQHINATLKKSCTVHRAKNPSSFIIVWMQCKLPRYLRFSIPTPKLSLRRLFVWICNLCFTTSWENWWEMETIRRIKLPAAPKRMRHIHQQHIQQRNAR